MPHVGELTTLPITQVAPTTADYVVGMILSHSGEAQSVLVPISLLPAGAGSLIVGTSVITGGGANHLLYDNAGVLGELTLGTGLSITTSTLNAGLVVGSTKITSGTNNRLLYDNSGTLGEAVVGSGLLLSGGTLSATGGGGSPGGSNTDVQYNQSSSFGGDGGFTYAGSGVVTIAGGTITLSAAALTITQTWNNSGVVFDAPLLIDVTNTASNALSVLFDFQVGGTSICYLSAATSELAVQTTAGKGGGLIPVSTGIQLAAFSGSSTLELLVGSTDVLDYGVTTASVLSCPSQLNVGTSSTDHLTLVGGSTGCTVGTSAGTLTFSPAGTNQLDYGVTNSGLWTFAAGTVFTGSITSKVRSSSSATITVSATTDYFLALDPTSNAITVNLPATPATGLTFEIKDATGQSGTHNITITPNSGNIDGSGTFVINTAYQSVGVTYNGSQWSIS